MQQSASEQAGVSRLTADQRGQPADYWQRANTTDLLIPEFIIVFVYVNSVYLLVASNDVALTV